MPAFSAISGFLPLVWLANMMPAGAAGGAGPAGGRGGFGNNRQPPGWSPERESTFPFRHWGQDLRAWSILATDMDSAQQCAAIILQLGGAAREFTRSMSYDEMTRGGIVTANGPSQFRTC